MQTLSPAVIWIQLKSNELFWRPDNIRWGFYDRELIFHCPLLEEDTTTPTSLSVICEHCSGQLLVWQNSNNLWADANVIHKHGATITASSFAGAKARNYGWHFTLKRSLVTSKQTWCDNCNISKLQQLEKVCWRGLKIFFAIQNVTNGTITSVEGRWK